MQFEHSEIGVIQQAIATFREWFANNVTNFFARENLGDAKKQPSEWGALEADLNVLLHESTKGGVQGLELADKHLPLLKRVLIVRRREEAERVRHLQDKTHHLEVLGSLDEELHILNRLVQKPWFRDVVPRDLPRITDLLPVQRVEELIGTLHRLGERKYDEKFHILQAPELFLPDLDSYRRVTDLRRTCTSVGFMDIDNFKQCNVTHTETVLWTEICCQVLCNWLRHTSTSTAKLTAREEMSTFC